MRRQSRGSLIAGFALVLMAFTLVPAMSAPTVHAEDRAAADAAWYLHVSGIT